MAARPGDGRARSSWERVLLGTGLVGLLALTTCTSAAPRGDRKIGGDRPCEEGRAIGLHESTPLGSPADVLDEIEALTVAARWSGAPQDAWYPPFGDDPSENEAYPTVAADLTFELIGVDDSYEYDTCDSAIRLEVEGYLSTSDGRLRWPIEHGRAYLTEDQLFVSGWSRGNPVADLDLPDCYQATASFKHRVGQNGTQGSIEVRCLSEKQVLYDKHVRRRYERLSHVPKTHTLLRW